MFVEQQSRLKPIMADTLTVANLIIEAERFCIQESTYQNLNLYGVTDGKAVGTLIEQKFKKHLSQTYTFLNGNSANGIDLPDAHILTDIKVTSIRQPQSSCPFKSARRKIYGLGYNLLLFVYDKVDDPVAKTALFQFVSCSFIDKTRTADYSTTYRLRQMLTDGANEEDIAAYLLDRNIPADDIQLAQLAHDIIAHPPDQGYLTISNALQWRLQYGRIVSLAGTIEGITKII